MPADHTLCCPLPLPRRGSCPTGAAAPSSARQACRPWLFQCRLNNSILTTSQGLHRTGNGLQMRHTRKPLHSGGGPRRQARSARWAAAASPCSGSGSLPLQPRSGFTPARLCLQLGSPCPQRRGAAQAPAPQRSCRLAPRRWCAAVAGAGLELQWQRARPVRSTPSHHHRRPATPRSRHHGRVPAPGRSWCPDSPDCRPWHPAAAR